MKAGRISSLRQQKSIRTILASVISILIGLAVGALIIFAVGISNSGIGIKGAWDGVQLIFAGIFSTGRDAVGTLTFGFNPNSVGNMLFRATPVILTGLSVALAFKTGLFNIGAAGQYLAGTAASLYIALSIPTSAVPAWIVWLLAFLGGMLAGAAMTVPGMLKAFFNINEVLACIMTNWIAANLVTWIFDVSSLKNVAESGKTGYIYKTTFNGVETSKLGLDRLFPGSQINGGILIAVVLAIIVYVLLNKTTFGFTLKACGSNRYAARYAGIRDKNSIIYAMALAGALAGTAGTLYSLSGNTEFYWTTYQALPAAGFNGIPVALLASSNPIGVIFSGIFMSALDIAGLQLTNLTAYNEYITDVIIGAIVYLSAFSLLIRTLLEGRRGKASPRLADSVPDQVPEEAEPDAGLSRMPE